MNKTNPYAKPDPLRGRFTRFMEILVKRARINYLEKLRRFPEMISIDDVPESALAIEDRLILSDCTSDFNFEEDRLSDAFMSLPSVRQRILTLLFVENLSPGEIAARLGCSVGHVYNQKSIALKKLRELLAEGGDER